MRGRVAAAKTTWSLRERDLASTWSCNRLAKRPTAGPTGAWRWASHRQCAVGLRKSHLQMFLHGAQFVKADAEWKLAKALQKMGERFSPPQLLLSLRVAARIRGSLLWTVPLVKLPRHAKYLSQQPGKLIKVIEAIHGEGSNRTRSEGGGVWQSEDRLPFAQEVSKLLCERPEEFGPSVLGVFCSLANHAGKAAFRKVSDEQIAALVKYICDQYGLNGKEANLTANDAAELLCALNRLGHGKPKILTSLKSSIVQNVQDVKAEHLPNLARGLGKGDQHEEYVLLHALCRRGSQVLSQGLLNAQAACTLLLVSCRWEIFDEDFLQNASKAVRDGAKDLSSRELCDIIYAVSVFQVRDAIDLDAVCDELTPRADGKKLAEGDMVRLMRGLLKLRHYHEALVDAFVPLVLESQTRLAPMSLCNLIGAFSYFGSGSEDFYVELLTTVTNRTSRLQPISVQHILTALCRLQGRVAGEKLQGPLDMLCGRIGQIALSSNGPAPFTPIQAMSSIAALAKLQQRDLAAASVFTSVLCGMGSHIHWSWVKSPYYFRHLKLGEGLWSCPFEAMACRRFLEGIQTSHCVEVLHSLSSLELSSRLTVHLTAMLCSILAPQLHDLRAKEVLVVARAFSVDRIPDSLWNGAEEPSRWRERALDHCFQSLRRHEHFLDTSYFTLLPFKLLCLQVNLGIFGTRKLEDFLNPMLLAFVERLNSLTKDDCETNRLRREGEEEEDNEAQNVIVDQGPVEIDCKNHRILLDSYLGDLQVDLLVDLKKADRWSARDGVRLAEAYVRTMCAHSRGRSASEDLGSRNHAMILPMEKDCHKVARF